jgi:hypothetical protein
MTRLASLETVLRANSILLGQWRLLYPQTLFWQAHPEQELRPTVTWNYIPFDSDRLTQLKHSL